VVLLCTVGVCAAGAALGPQIATVVGCKEPGPYVSGVQEDAKRVREILPVIGEPSSVRWRWREARPRTCPDLGPMRYVYEGFAVLAPERLTALRTGYSWSPAMAPDVPAVLAPLGPTAPAWRRSAALDAAARGSLWLDEPSRTVYFTYVRS
jgi:hypothetical protein